MEMNESFWEQLDTMVSSASVIVYRSKGIDHPTSPNTILELGYGRLLNESSGTGVEVWRGSSPQEKVDAVICLVDLLRHISEFKLLISCTETEKAAIHHFYNTSPQRKGILIRRQK